MAKLYLALTVDVDPDNFDCSIFGSSRGLSWQGVEQGLEPLLEGLNHIKDGQDAVPKYTWFVRCDNEIKSHHGEFTYLFAKYAEFWRERETSADEIAWHPHVNSLEQLRESFLALSQLGKTFKTVRVGKAHNSNAFMSELEVMGFTADSSALPERLRQDGDWDFDWTGTPQKPYYPTKADYRIPGAKSLDILEVPMTMLDTKVDYDQEIVRRYFNLSYRHEIVNKSIAELVKTRDLLLTNLHPSELLSPGGTHPLLSFDIKTVVKNLEFVLEQAQQQGRSVEFVTLADIVRLSKQGIISNAQT